MKPSLTSLALRGLKYHRKSYVGVFVGSALAAIILTGALAVGDSVRFTLKSLNQARLGKVGFALATRDRFFRNELATELEAKLKVPTATIMQLSGTTSLALVQGDALRVGPVRVMGIDSKFWRLGPNAVETAPAWQSQPDTCALNRRLAQRLGAIVGSELQLRIEKPSLLSREAPLSTVADSSIPLKLTVGAVLTDDQFGRFGLDANQTPPLNLFVDSSTLHRVVGMAGRANLLLAGDRTDLDVRECDSVLWGTWTLADADLQVTSTTRAPGVELRTDRVFLDQAAAQAAQKAAPDAMQALTYFVNGLESNGRATPYSTVTAIDMPAVTGNLKDDEIALTSWTANDLSAKLGDKVAVKYWVVGSARRLVERSSDFTVKAIIPVDSAAVDPALMPNIPGLSDKKNCKDWEPGVPVKLDRIRDKDQKYWETYKGAPKAFIRLGAGRKIWANRFGDLTSVRYPNAKVETVKEGLRRGLNPAALGLFFTAVGASAGRTGGDSLDFGGLFIGFSFFLIISAVLLTAMLFGFGVQQRAAEVGTLMALGWREKQVRNLLTLEGFWIAIPASIVGAVGGLAYTVMIVRSLSSVWGGAVAGSEIRFHAQPSTIIMGALLSLLVSVLAVWWVARRVCKRSARSLLAGETESSGPTRAASGRVRWLAWVASLAGLGVLISGFGRRGEADAEKFFAAGALLLIGGLAWIKVLLDSRRGSRGVMSLWKLSLRSTTRRSGRSLAVCALLASGTFLVIAVGAGREDVTKHSDRRESGTGGFALIGESSLPVFQDLNTPAGREPFGIEAGDLPSGVRFLSMRVREGDEASCLNLNRARVPRLLGANTMDLKSMRPFKFAKELMKDSGWNTFREDASDGIVNAVGDSNTVVWSLGRSLGEEIPMIDDRGRPFKLKITAILENSILQGSLIISERQFERLFPSSAGYKYFLIDAPKDKSPFVAATLNRALEDSGMILTPAVTRLEEFSVVENTYLSIFAALGGLGLILGSGGLGVVVLRNVLDRRSELALMRAVGFKTEMLRTLIFREHILLMIVGIVVGAVAALAAVAPSLDNVDTNTTLRAVGVQLLLVLATGSGWVALSSRSALAGRLLDSLRSE